MSKTKVFGALDGELMKDHIYGLAGIHQKITSLIRKPSCALVENDYWKVLLFYNPADKEYHKPQDAIGIYLEQENLALSLSDGVSIVGGTNENMSGELAADLVKASLLNQDESYFNELKEKYTKDNSRGASTLQYVKFNKDLITIKIVGPKDDLGELLFLDKKKLLLSINKGSENFFPYNDKINDLTYDNYSIKGVILTSDGIRFIQEDCFKIFSVLRKESDLKIISSVLKWIVPFSPDDQSAIIAIRTDYQI